jgi:hypothetical protein
VTRILIPIVAVAALIATAVTQAATKRNSAGPKWATVNVCSPNAMGVRASLPGNGTDQRMQVRFTAQWLSHARGAWLPVAGVPRSPWIDAGSARYTSRQAGWTFSIDRPAPGQSFRLRGVAELRWLDGDRVVRSATHVTRAGVGAVHVGGVSLASCGIGQG